MQAQPNTSMEEESPDFRDEQDHVRPFVVLGLKSASLACLLLLPFSKAELRWFFWFSRGLLEDMTTDLEAGTFYRMHPRVFACGFVGFNAAKKGRGRRGLIDDAHVTPMIWFKPRPAAVTQSRDLRY